MVEWKAAIRCAIVVSLVAALLSMASASLPSRSPLSWLSWFWIASGSAVALTLYQRYRPQAWMDAAVGARIGLLVGLALVVSIAISMSIAGLVARYKLHAMAPFDAEWKQQVDKAISMNPQSAMLGGFFYSPEFKAGIMLAGFAMMAGFVTILSTLGGALSGMLRTRRTV